MPPEIPVPVNENLPPRPSGQGRVLRNRVVETVLSACLVT
ncbi:MAG: hypothetical protein JWM61_2804, partial [Micrococcaceae bacterium]|nr:hypothetical protein [Micrococcaceae bacterium]